MVKQLQVTRIQPGFAWWCHMRYTCFGAALASFTLTTRQSEKLAKRLSPSWLLGRFERLKVVLMGTGTPHTWIPGLVWQKQARRFSQFELQVGGLGFPIHFLCVSTALYHRGHTVSIFLLGEYGPSQFPFWTLGLSLTSRAEAMARHVSISESCWCHKLLLNPSNSIIELNGQSWVKRHEPNRLFRPQRSSSKRLQTWPPLPFYICPKWGGFWFVWKSDEWYFHWRQSPHEEIFSTWNPVFQLLFFDFLTLDVSWYASAQRAELRDSWTACARVEISKARSSLRTLKARVPCYQWTYTRTN